MCLLCWAYLDLLMCRVRALNFRGLFSNWNRVVGRLINVLINMQGILRVASFWRSRRGTAFMLFFLFFFDDALDPRRSRFHESSRRHFQTNRSRAVRSIPCQAQIGAFFCASGQRMAKFGEIWIPFGNFNVKDHLNIMHIITNLAKF